MKSPSNACSICKGPIIGYGNNAAPVNNGRCCDECNAMVVIPARIVALQAAQKS
jgi:hypothetical protein